nr:hypothetical protein [uncultured Campylobacter sp.]
MAFCPLDFRVLFILLARLVLSEIFKERLNFATNKSYVNLSNFI